MSGNAGAPQENLTGVWEGLYTYDRVPEVVGFCATLIETPGWLTGSIHEIATDGVESGTLICSTLEGHRLDQSVTFTKTYEGNSTSYRSVHYTGAVSEDHTEINGTWRINPQWTGRFVMVRSGGVSAEERQAASEGA